MAFPSSASMREGRQKYIYGRWNNPSTEALTQALKQLEHAEGTVLCPSGLSACTTAILSAVGAGDHLLIADNVYAPIRAFCEQVGNRLGIEVSFYDPTIGAGVVDFFKPNTKAIYTESPGSLTLEIQDIPAIAKVAHEHNILVIADNTWGTPLYFPSLELGVDLSIMAATLANGGVNPVTSESVVDAIHCQHVLAVMVTAGLYENSGDWLYATGLPGKSGVSGGMITVAPGKGGLATFSSPLDEAGNSVRGQLTARHLSERLGLNLFASEPFRA